MNELIELCKRQIEWSQQRQSTCQQMQTNNPFGGSKSYWQLEELNALNEQLKWERTLSVLEARNANFLARSDSDNVCGETGREASE